MAGGRQEELAASPRTALPQDTTGPQPPNSPIVFFDSDCLLCLRAVRWLLKLDREGNLRFASLRGETALQLVPQKYRAEELTTIVYWRASELFVESDAVLEMVRDLGGAWSLLAAVTKVLIPRRWRDGLYRHVANHRYRISQRIPNSCQMPDQPVEMSRLLP